LGVEVGEHAGGEQRVVGDIDPGHQVPGVEGHLLGLGEEVRRVRGERQGADRLYGRQFLWNDLGRIQQVDALERLLRGVREGLDTEIPVRICAGLDGVGEVSPVEVRVDPGEDLRLLPDQGVHAGGRLSVELHQRGPAVGVHESEGVDAEPLHHPP
jgi:hypothetical protein